MKDASRTFLDFLVICITLFKPAYHNFSFSPRVSNLCTCLIFFFIRKKNNKNNDSGAEKPHELIVAKPAKVDQQQDSYFVLDKCSHEIPKESKSVAENPYNESRDGIYDHLRDNTSRKKEVEDTYQHAPAATSEDMSDYDTMANSVKNLEQDSTYDHAHQNINRNSDYGYNLQANKSSNENPYDVANGKNY